ncbi:ubiquitin carboxyl-terminal hydrolase-domain-containing protein [Phascolomyces articulosus]|uniref:ubiquitinyl hydrolase 1 n=1 Tax=Phascolomyces articulosus TaxID=60185 RepID=A0AAD5K862_9FUNG|nr:ubiquitin carboxyl-terminal hydrolase-domain-containing protein [Phascolomyces articulosus]
MGKKRSFIKSFLFPHHRHSSHNNEVKLTEEQATALASISHYAQHHLSITSLNQSALTTILESNAWDTQMAANELEDYHEADSGLLWPPPRIESDTVLLGSENDAYTSCYIDSLLFAMFVGLSSFDPLLTYEISDQFEPQQRLQTLLRFFVNKLRKGHLIKAEFIRCLRKALQAAKWAGCDVDGAWTQEDASELFMFITETFDLPYLPFQIRLFHGAERDMDDDRVMTDRVLSIAVPEDHNAKLENLLLDHFYDNIITGIKRKVGNDQSSQQQRRQHRRRQSLSRNTSNEEDHGMSSDGDELSITKGVEYFEMVGGEEGSRGKGRRGGQVEVTAWQVLELLPFYSGMNEQGNSIETQTPQNFPDWHLMLPIVLNRYRYDQQGNSHKIKTIIDIPEQIEFNRFVNRNTDYPVCGTCGRRVECVMRLQSAVCHKGDSVYSGHYIAYAKASNNTDNLSTSDDNEIWLKFDDLDATKRVRTIIGRHGTVQAELSRDAYVVFYELVKLCNHDSTTPHSMDIKGPQSVVFDETVVITPKDGKEEHETLDTRVTPTTTTTTTTATTTKSTSSSFSSIKLSCKFI